MERKEHFKNKQLPTLVLWVTTPFAGGEGEGGIVYFIVENKC